MPCPCRSAGSVAKTTAGGYNGAMTVIASGLAATPNSNSLVWKVHFTA